MKKQFLLMAFFSHALGFAQNLVANGDFEQTEQFVFGTAGRGIWSTPNRGSPDLFICTEENAGYNFVGNQKAHSGSHYCGLIVKNSSPDDYREYIQTQLVKPLVPGAVYKLSFYVSLADWESKYGSSSIGALFTTRMRAEENRLPLAGTVQCMNPPENVVTDKENWTLLTFSFTADSAYEFVSIGNFFDEISTQFSPVRGGRKERSYFYIDDVSLVQTDCIKDPLGICGPVAKTEAPGRKPLPR